MDILSSCTFELEDIEIIDPNTEDEEKLGKWHCDQCSLFFLDRGKLAEHKKKHTGQEVVNCKYCNKKISSVGLSKECYKNRKCETCEYKCSKCPQRFLRRSSLVNHEKKHSSPKKKKTNPNSIIVEEAASPTGIKRKRVEMDEKLNEVKNVMKRSPKKKVSLKVKEQATLDIENTSNKMPKRLSSKDVKSVEDKNYQCSTKTPKQSNIKSNQNTITKHSQIVPLTSNTIKSENVINYKPFSCHMCQGRFASDEALLNHIKTHGENADRSFKCKFCNDEFDDVYKMQYHLAICPLAEDELESTLKQVIPTISPIKYSEEVPSSRKRGRPKKTEVLPDDHDDDEIECTPSSKRGRHRKIEEAPDIHDGGKNESTPSFTRGRTRKNKSDKKEKLGLSTPTLPTKSNKLPQKEFLSEPNSFTENEVEDPLTSDVTETMIESETIDEMKKIHQCPFPRCDFKFTREKALLCHMRNHSDDFEDSLKCHKCDIPFDDVHTLRLHINTCKGIKEEKDDDFGRADSHDSSPSRTSLKTKKDFICVQCGRSYPNVEKLKSHNCQGAASNCVNVKFPCRLCGKPLHNPNMLKTHFEECHPDHLQFQCPTCIREFDLLDDINAHMMEHIKNIYDCTICLMRCTSRSELNKHYTAEHTTDRTLCQICNKRFADASGLAKHRHIHTGQRPYFCPFCFRTFNLKSSQVNHVRRHINFRPYICNTCPKSFFNSGDLRKHIRIHTGEKPYQCEICKARFRTKDVFNAHMRTHSNIRPYKCFQCPKAFKTKTFLRYHISIHSGIRSCVCPVCPEKFYQMLSLRSHLRKSHITSNLECELCDTILDNKFVLVDHLLSHRVKTSQVTEPNCSVVDDVPITHAIKKKGGRPRKGPKQSNLTKSTQITQKKQVRSKKSIKNSKPMKTTGTKKNNNKTKNSRKKRGQINTISDEKRQTSPPHEEDYNDQSQDEINQNAVQEESGNIQDIIEIVEVKEEPWYEEEEEQESYVSQIEKCLLCLRTFCTREELMEHVYIHV